MRYRDENKVQAIRERAIEMIAKEGLENFSINRLAKAAGVSPATIYIYYKDKEDLITTISIEEGLRMVRATLNGFDPTMPFKDALWLQWKNRAVFNLENSQSAFFFDQLTNSTYREQMLEVTSEEYAKTIGKYVKGAMDNGVIEEMALVTYWSLAFAPLYSLINFHKEGRDLNGKKFELTPAILEQAFNCVIKGLLK
ncbi:TetR/AcrR family transcriptional regulator [Chitinophaga silvatica]|uniref:TetR/AcrR family transcriptional regulator n=1 Tax=Chitinophaga silvatica TaxID=2282649 RepID=A0A3E1YG14_9BACT|nr:TetR/AcrR family transcriptional regulator [Chitinophaga silvatica]RFS26343.1 TetR/AcrR family transcriptional regulator [Chitinophaga silvatica]